MKILLTGATGYLGGNLLRRFRADGFEIMVLARAASNMSRIQDALSGVRVLYTESCDYEALFRDLRPDAVVHCATSYGRKAEAPLSILEANLMLPLKLLQAGTGAGLKCFVNTDTILDKRVSYYSLSKSQFRDWLRLYAEKLACVNVSLEHFYGPGDDASKFAAWVVHSLVNGVPRLALTPGKQKRDFVYIDDVCSAFSAILADVAQRVNGFRAYEVGAGEPVSVREFVGLVKELAGNKATELAFGAIPYRENEIMEYKTDLAEIKALGWRPMVPLKEGLAKTIEFEGRRKQLK